MSPFVLRILSVCLVLNLATAASKKPQQEPEDDTTEDCPEPNGFFADAEQCDKYYACVDGVATEKLCPDGMVFNDYSPDQEKCDLPYNIDCSKRSKLQEPIPTLHCPRLNGYFGHADKGVCDKFYYCVDGKFNMITCPSGLVFNPKTGICTWPDEAQKLGCTSEDVFQFSCPKVNESEAQTHPRYADPDDCQFFYVCINGEVPRRNGCKLGQVFDDVHKKCEWARKVPECADWYKDRLTDAELDELEHPKPKVKQHRTKGPSRRKPSRKVEEVRDEEE
ncbi:protein obstructor-E [Hermetia illucens]|nr:protein obstructor-E [Hermetia illucens]